MKLVCSMAFLFIGFIQIGVASNDLDSIRNRFKNAKSENDFQWILNYKVKETDSNIVNTINAYKAVSKSAMAQYVFNPYSKFKYFFDGRDELEETISKNMEVENIFLRSVVQLSIPKFLGYSDEIESDLKFLKENLPNAKVPLDIKKFIIETIVNTGNRDYDLDSLSLLPLN